MQRREPLRLPTPYQRQYVRLVASGLTNRQMARELELSEGSVANMLSRLFTAYGVCARGELVGVFLERGWL